MSLNIRCGTVNRVATGTRTHEGCLQCLLRSEYNHVANRADMYALGPLYCTYGLPVAAFCALLCEPS